ncbi:hypothetical protein SLEP1_g46744 [Rubroshorea leprosula]|uniref:Uncharacterized protein n=1 Tax=Rubroshorea leprosula TaxID=152421 RepID=A0AAV5LN88_9ROSI|nr:hypothetical protein SLEP1_g46744 [Rubroshorea leprosula]
MMLEPHKLEFSLNVVVGTNGCSLEELLQEYPAHDNVKGDHHS